MNSRNMKIGVRLSLSAVIVCAFGSLPQTDGRLTHDTHASLPKVVNFVPRTSHMRPYSYRHTYRFLGGMPRHTHVPAITPSPQWETVRFAVLKWVLLC
jgi:hypothetical protein